MQNVVPQNSRHFSPASAPNANSGSQLVAFLLLGELACHLQNLPAANAYVAQAQASVVTLSRLGRTVRPEEYIKIVHVASEVSGSTQTLRLPVVDGILRLPDMDVQDLARARRGALPGSAIVNLSNVEMSYHRMRLRIVRLSHALAGLLEMQDVPCLAAGIAETLAQCLHSVFPAVGPLDRADDYLTLALNLLHKRNQPLAKLALGKARISLQSYADMSQVEGHADRADRLALHIADLMRSLDAAAS